MKFFRFVIAFAALLIPIALVPTAAHASTVGSTRLYVHSSHAGWCLDLPIKVAPAKNQPKAWTVAVTFCQPFKPTREVDVLTHGATYTRAYWDWSPGLYSYVGKTLTAGRATLNYDRIGNGASTRPLSTEITMASDAYVLNQLITYLRLLGFKQINSIGHSYGSGVVLAEAVTFKDVHTAVLTGYLHRPSNPQVTAGNYPANQDAKFADLGLDNGWLTTRPGARAYGFHAPDSDPALVAEDELNKDLVSLTGLLGFLGDRNVPAVMNISNQLRAPVLEMVGQRDAIFCYDSATFDCSNIAAVTANEAPYFTAPLQVSTIAGSGHDLTLHPSADDSFAVINDWLRSN